MVLRAQVVQLKKPNVVAEMVPVEMSCFMFVSFMQLSLDVKDEPFVDFVRPKTPGGVFYFIAAEFIPVVFGLLHDSKSLGTPR